jgi:hypothetical protein
VSYVQFIVAQNHVDESFSARKGGVTLKDYEMLEHKNPSRYFVLGSGSAEIPEAAIL